MSGVTATSGFSDKVALGTLGSIRQDPTVVMRVETTYGKEPGREDAYWRGLAFDHFDGSTWSITPPGRDPVPGSAEGGVTFTHQPDRVNLIQTIIRDPVEAGVLFGIGRKRGLHGTIRRLETDVNGGLYARAQSHERIRYTIESERTEWGDAALERDTAVPPKWAGDRYLQLPELSGAVAILAHEITREKGRDAEKARAIERYLFANGRYSDTLSTVDDSGGKSSARAFLVPEHGRALRILRIRVRRTRAQRRPARTPRERLCGRATQPDREFRRSLASRRARLGRSPL